MSKLKHKKLLPALIIFILISIAAIIVLSSNRVREVIAVQEVEDSIQVAIVKYDNRNILEVVDSSNQKLFSLSAENENVTKFVFNPSKKYLAYLTSTPSAPKEIVVINLENNSKNRITYDSEDLQLIFCESGQSLAYVAENKLGVFTGFEDENPESKIVLEYEKYIRDDGAVIYPEVKWSKSEKIISVNLLAKVDGKIVNKGMNINLDKAMSD